MVADRGRKRPGANALGQADQLRQLGGKPSVDDNQPKRQRRVRNGGEIGCRHDRGRRCPKLGRRDRRYVGEPPLFVTHRREAEGGEARRAAVAKVLQPPRATQRTRLERGTPGL